MHTATDSSLHENIMHRTNTAPYSIHFTEVSPHTTPALYLHWHDEMEFLFLTKGKLKFHIEEQVFQLQEGEGIFIPPGLLHMGEHAQNQGCSFYAFVLSPDFLFSLFDSDNFHKYVQPILHNNMGLSLHLEKNIPWHHSILHHLHAICNAPEEGELYVRGRTFLIWDLLYSHHLTACSVTPAMQSQRLNTVISFIQTHYQQSITLGQLADLVHLSEGQFCRLFKTFTGMSPNQYLIRYRILQSCQLLLQTDQSITQIALSCGFNNISYYNRAFLKIMNTPPGEYRSSNFRQNSNCKL